MVTANPRVTAPRLGRSFFVPALLCSLVLALLAFQVFLTFGFDWRGAPELFRPSSSSVAGFVAILAMSGVGTLVAWRRPANRIGWLLLAIAITACFLDFPRLYAGVAIYLHPGLPGADWLYWLSQIVWMLVFGELLILLPLWFPNGRLLSRRWAIVMGVAAIPVILVIAGSLDPAATAPVRNPLGVPAMARLNNALNGAPFAVLLLGTYGLGVSSLVVRYQRGGEQERQQLKWLLASV